MSEVPLYTLSLNPKTRFCRMELQRMRLEFVQVGSLSKNKST